MQREKIDILKDFYLFSEYFKKEGRIKDLNGYKENCAAFLFHAEHLKAYDFVVRFCKSKRVLDIGCLIGYGEKIIGPYAKEVIAVDIDYKALEFARKKCTSSNVKFIQADARRLPFSDNIFDVAVAFQFIEHIPPNEVSVCLHEVKRVIRNKGLLFISTPNRKFRLRMFQRPFNPEHYQEFTAKGLLKVLKPTFKDIEIMGVRAKKWIEEIQRKRVQKSAYQVYIRESLSRLLNAVFPEGAKNLLKKIKSQIPKLSQSKGTISTDREQFSNLFQKFSMDDFYLEKQKGLVDKSLDLFAICKK